MKGFLHFLKKTASHLQGKNSALININSIKAKNAHKPLSHVSFTTLFMRSISIRLPKLSILYIFDTLPAICSTSLSLILSPIAITNA